MDTVYFLAALDEFNTKNGYVTVLSVMDTGELSAILHRAQQLKEAEQAARIEEQRGTKI